jgi:hypothetical protein
MFAALFGGSIPPETLLGPPPDRFVVTPAGLVCVAPNPPKEKFCGVFEAFGTWFPVLVPKPLVMVEAPLANPPEGWLVIPPKGALTGLAPLALPKGDAEALNVPPAWAVFAELKGLVLEAGRAPNKLLLPGAPATFPGTKELDGPDCAFGGVCAPLD